MLSKLGLCGSDGDQDAFEMNDQSGEPIGPLREETTKLMEAVESMEKERKELRYRPTFYGLLFFISCACISHLFIDSSIEVSFGKIIFYCVAPYIYLFIALCNGFFWTWMRDVRRQYRWIHSSMVRLSQTPYRPQDARKTEQCLQDLRNKPIKDMIFVTIHLLVYICIIVWAVFVPKPDSSILAVFCGGCAYPMGVSLKNVVKMLIYVYKTKKLGRKYCSIC